MVVNPYLSAPKAVPLLSGTRNDRPQFKRLMDAARKAGKSVNAIRKELKIGYGTAWNYVRALERATG